MTGQQATITRADTTGARYSTVRMLVPWSQGEQTSIATIRNTCAVQVGATTYPTRWRVRGAPHNDGSIRFTYAEWFMEVANGNLASGAPQHTATVVAHDNSGTGAASFAAWADQLNITIAYTSETGSSVSTDIAVLARGGTNGSIYTVSDEGGTRFITYDVWIGPGRRHEPKRSLYATYRNTRGPSVGNNVVLRNGLLHVVAKIEIRDQEDHALVELQFRNDAGYPYPSAPPDGGERTPGQPARPTQLNPAATNPITGTTEQLESRLFRQFVNGITVTISHGSTTVYSRPFYVANHTTGAGPFGTITSSGNGTTVLPIRGLADGQCWGIRFAVSDVSTTEAAFWASHAAYGWIAVPTYATWLATERSRTLVGGEVDGDTITRLGWDFALAEGIPSGSLTAWRLRGHNPSSVNWMNQTVASPWRTVPIGEANRENPNGGGKHFGVGLLHEGEAMLAGSPEYLYKVGGWAIRESLCRPQHYEHDALETLDHLTGSGGNEHYTAYFFGSANEGTSIVQFGRRQFGRLSNDTAVAHFNGSPAVRTNPDPEPDLYSSGPNWGTYGPNHIGMRPLFIHSLLTDSATDRYILRDFANVCRLNKHMRIFSGAGPAANAVRGECRPLWLMWQAWVLSDDTTFRDLIRSSVMARVLGWLNSASAGYWNPIGWTNVGTGRFYGGACGMSSETDIDHMLQWWLNGQAGEQFGNWMIDATTDEVARTIGTAIMYMSRTVVDYGWWCDPTRLPAAARRTGTNGRDDCFASVAPTYSGLEYPAEGLLAPRHARVNRAASTNLVASVQNVSDRAGRRNHAEISQQWPCLPLSLVFAANRARAGHTDRVAFIRQAMIAIFPEIGNGDAYTDDPNYYLGFATGDSYRPATQGPPPNPTFTVSTRAGIIPLEVTLNPAASTINGNTALATYRWWDHYIAGATPSATGTGVPGSRVVTYNGPGIFRPALEITQEDGQVRLYVDGPGIDARPAVVLPPVPRFSASPSSITAGEGDVVQFTYVELGGRAETYVWEYRIESPGPGGWTAFGNGVRDPQWPDPGVAGSYSFRVTATNTTGSGSHTATNLVRVSPPVPPPTASFSPSATSGNAPLTVQFNASATTFSGAAAAVEWKWWDNFNEDNPADATVTGPSGSAYETTYNTPGLYYPGLKVTQADGKYHIFIYTPGLVITATPVSGPPQPNFSLAPRNVTGGDSVHIHYIDRVPELRATSWAWYSRENGTTTWELFSQDANPTWIAPVAVVDKSYDFRVVATNEHDSAERTKSNHVKVDAVTPPPNAVFTVDVPSGPAPLTVTFDASSSTVQGNAAVAEWNWRYDDAQSAATESITGPSGSSWEYEYTLPGVFYPSVRIVQEDGQADREVYLPGIIVTTDPSTDPPEGTITVDDDTAEPRQTLVITWNDAGILATSHVWYYSEGGAENWIEFSRLNPAQLEAPTVAGTYDVRCEATNQNGTTTVDEPDLFTVAAGSAPVASFTLSKYRFDRNDPLYPQPFCTVTDASTDAESWTWRIDPVGTIFYGQAPPAFQLPGKGTHRISLTVANAYGSSTTTKLVTVTTGRQRVVVYDPKNIRNRRETEGT